MCDIPQQLAYLHAEQDSFLATAHARQAMVAAHFQGSKSYRQEHLLLFGEGQQLQVKEGQDSQRKGDKHSGNWPAKGVAPANPRLPLPPPREEARLLVAVAELQTTCRVLRDC